MEQYKKELNNAKAEVERLKTDKKSAKAQVTAIEKEMSMRNGYIREIEDEHKAVKREVGLFYKVEIWMFEAINLKIGSKFAFYCHAFSKKVRMGKQTKGNLVISAAFNLYG